MLERKEESSQEEGLSWEKKGSPAATDCNATEVAMVTPIECVGGWLMIYTSAVQWVSAVTYPDSLTASVWMVPGWADG